MTACRFMPNSSACAKLPHPVHWAVVSSMTIIASSTFGDYLALQGYG
jgi:hypothetical protein